MELENVNIKNWKSLIKPAKLDVKISDDLTHATIVAEPVSYTHLRSPRDLSTSRMPSSA